MDIKHIKGIVFEGGGITSIAYVGVLKILQEWGIRKQLTHFAGASAGAIIASMLACGASLGYIEKKLKELDFKQFQDDSKGDHITVDIVRLLLDYGWYKGDFLEKWYSNILEEITGNRDITFGDIQNIYNTFLSVTITDVRNSGCYTIHINSDNNPNMFVRKAVRKSAGIPLYFKPLCEKDNTGICHSYIDGGLLNNYPIHSLCNFLKHEQVIGIRLVNTKKNTLASDLDRTEIPNVIKFIEILIEGLRIQALTYNIKPDDYKRTIIVDIFNYTSTNFNISKKDINILIKQGELSADKFLISCLQ